MRLCMKPLAGVLLVAATGFFATPVSAAVYLLGDAGTSFSPHGVGIGAGYRFRDIIAVEAGTGHSKNRRAGVPVSVDLRGPAKDEGFYSLVGATEYFGKGRVGVAYEGARAGGDDAVVDSDATWQVIYGRLGCGYQTPTAQAGGRIFFDSGIAVGMYSKIAASPGDYDDSNLGRPKGIATGGAYDSGHVGAGDLGIFVRVGLSHDLF